MWRVFLSTVTAAVIELFMLNCNNIFFPMAYAAEHACCLDIKTNKKFNRKSACIILLVVDLDVDGGGGGAFHERKIARVAFQRATENKYFRIAFNWKASN